MSSSVEYTEAQIHGVTDTSERESSAEYFVEPDDPGGTVQQTIEKATYGELECLIPGEGEPHEECGTAAPNQFCDGEENHVHFGKHDCGRKECPRCWNSQWAKPRTASVSQKLSAVRYAEPDGIDRRLVHGFFSPEMGDITSIEGMFEAREKAIELAKSHGIRTGVMIVHPYRPTKETKKRFEEANSDGGIWRFIRENERHWYGQVYFSPHFHVIGLCRDFEEAEEEEDWVIQNLSTGRGVEPNPSVDRRFAPMTNLTEEEPYEDIIGTIRYLLSHTAVVDERDSVTWFGEAHGFNPEEELSGGAWNTIQRIVEELTGVEDDRPEEDDPEEEECPVEDCDGYLHPIWDVPDYIDQRGDDLSIEALVKLRTAFDWAIGDDQDEEAPPDGWPMPRTEEDARDAFEDLLEDGREVRV